MKLSRKGPVYQASSAEDRLMRAYGLPSRYWGVTERDGVGLAVHVRTVAITRSYNNAAMTVAAERQKKLLRELLTDADSLRKSRVIVVGSVPTDELGMTFGAALIRRARALRLRPMMVSMRHHATGDVSGDPDVVILHNLTGECHAMRAQVCRDWLDRFDDTLRVVVVGGIDPYTFCHTRLHAPLDGGIYFEGESREDV